MGCFLGCFGTPKDRRRRKRRDKVQPRENRGTAVDDHAQSGISLVREFPEKSIVPTAEIIDKPAEKSNLSPRKRVTFDTNVKTYEHVLPNESIDFSKGKEEETRKEKEENTGAKENSVKPSQSQSSSENSLITSSSGSYPPNHRYQNCRESDDEEEDVLDYEESDIDDDDEELLDEENDYDDGYYEDVDDRISRVKEVYTEEVADNGSQQMDGFGQEIGVKLRGSNASARDRSGYVHPVLNPVENLSQWKAVKSKGRTPQLKPQKENLVSDQEEARASFSSEPRLQELSYSFKAKSNHEAKNSKNQEIAVDASLSTWLSPSETTRVSNSGSVGFGAATPNKSMSHGSNSQRSREDRPILGALTVEEIKQFSASSSRRKSPSRSPDTPIIGTVGGYWNHSLAAKDSGSASSIKGIPNTTSKYREDKRVNWHSTPFETRLERALNRGVGVAEH